MKIGLFTDGYEPQVSGLVTSVKMLKEELEKLGNEVIIITLSDKNYYDDENKILYFKGATIPLKGLDEYKCRRLRRKDVNKIKELNLEQIHVHTEYSMGNLGLKCAKKFNIPIIYTSHTMVLDYLHYAPFILKPFAKRLLKKNIKKFHYKTDATIYPTKKVLNAYKGILKKDFNYEIIPTGIDLNNFNFSFSLEEKEKFKKELGIKTKKVSLCLGRLAEEKSVDVVIKGFKDIKDNTLLIVGDGPERKNLEKLVTKLGINDKVVFTGMIEWKNLGKYYKVADVFISASITETQGLTYAEALASGLPVICRYDVNLDGVIIENHNGFFFTTEEDFKVLLSVFFNKDISLLSENAIKVSKELSKEIYGEKVFNLYNKK